MSAVAKTPAEEVTASSSDTKTDTAPAEEDTATTTATAATAAGESSLILGTESCIKEVLYSEEILKEKCEELAAQINADYAGTEIVCVCMLRGAYMFFSTLVARLRMPVKVDFLQCSSYSGTSTTGKVTVTKDLSIDPLGQHLLVIEDMIDTGTTLAWLTEHLKGRGCASVEICCLMNKKARRTKKVTAKYIGFDDCPNVFIVGFGGDYKGVSVFECV